MSNESGTGGFGPLSLTPACEKVYVALAETMLPMTVQQIAEMTGMGTNTVGPRCHDLHKLGLAEPIGKQLVSQDSTVKRTVWKVVFPERREEVAAKAAQKPPRRKSVLDATTRERAHLVKLLIKDPEVNKMLLQDKEDQSKAAQHARREAKDEQVAKKKNDDDLRRAIAEGDPLARFYATKSLLYDGTEAMRGLLRNLYAEQEDRSYGEGCVPNLQLGDVWKQVEQQRIFVKHADELIRRMAGDDSQIIDAEAVEDDVQRQLPGQEIYDAIVVLELPPGDALGG